MASEGARDKRASTPNETAWLITGRLITGIVLYGGVGWLLGRWLGHQQLFIAGGILFGMAAGLYLVYARLKYDDAHNVKPPRSRK
ncbi:MAG: AtpZ/AtpI family protein [Candidatus Nanopelagicales bacterium]